jgi:hypothetical protein
VGAEPALNTLARALDPLFIALEAFGLCLVAAHSARATLETTLFRVKIHVLKIGGNGLKKAYRVPSFLFARDMMTRVASNWPHLQGEHAGNSGNCSKLTASTT